jgi:hypothetical protein
LKELEKNQIDLLYKKMEENKIKDIMIIKNSRIFDIKEVLIYLLIFYF